jgi:calcineurin-like phosphoesterase family protein
MRIQNNNKLWFTADPHFNHKHIIRLSKRPFQSLDEMHYELITRWNSVVKKDHTVFLIGDFCFGSPKQWAFLENS